MLIDIEIGTGFSIHILDLNRLEMPQLFYGTSVEILIFLNSSRFTITNIWVYGFENGADEMSFG